MKMLLVSDAWITHQDGVTLHPELFLWQDTLHRRYQKQWFDCSPHNPLSLYAELQAVSPVSLLLRKKLEKESINGAQFWIASPYHARMGRDSIRLLPEALVPWCEQDARWLCALLNPLLAEEGMQLHALGAALLLSCQKRLDAAPVPFAAIAGDQLPNRHPEGMDGGRLMRLLSEIQMLLNQFPAKHRRERGEPDIHGLWLWGGAEDIPDQPLQRHIAVATRNPCLDAVTDGKDAALIITEAENVRQLVRSEQAKLPKYVMLSGGEHALLLRQRMIPRWGSACWQPHAMKDEANLWQALRQVLELRDH